MRNHNKVVKIIKTDKLSEPITTSKNFIFNSKRNRINYFIESSIPVTGEIQERYQSSLKSIYESKNGIYLMETDSYRVVVEISNMEN